jgi:hypothetical protein
MMIFIPLLAFLDRFAGGGFKSLPSPFNDGWKPARRILIPLTLWLTQPRLETVGYALMLGYIFCLNLDEIEDRNWDEISVWSLCLFFALKPFSGFWATIPATWWPIGIYLSNFGIKLKFWAKESNGIKTQFYLDWFWVELIRGACIGLAIWLYHGGLR